MDLPASPHPSLSSIPRIRVKNKSLEMTPPIQKECINKHRVPSPWCSASCCFCDVNKKRKTHNSPPPSSHLIILALIFAFTVLISRVDSVMTYSSKEQVYSLFPNEDLKTGKSLVRFEQGGQRNSHGNLRGPPLFGDRYRLEDNRRDHVRSYALDRDQRVTRYPNKNLGYRRGHDDDHQTSSNYNPFYHKNYLDPLRTRKPRVYFREEERYQNNRRDGGRIRFEDRREEDERSYGSRGPWRHIENDRRPLPTHPYPPPPVDGEAKLPPRRQHPAAPPLPDQQEPPTRVHVWDPKLKTFVVSRSRSSEASKNSEGNFIRIEPPGPDVFKDHEAYLEYHRRIASKKEKESKRLLFSGKQPFEVEEELRRLKEMYRTGRKESENGGSSKKHGIAGPGSSTPPGQSSTSKSFTSVKFTPSVQDITQSNGGVSDAKHATESFVPIHNTSLNRSGNLVAPSQSKKVQDATQNRPTFKIPGPKFSPPITTFDSNTSGKTSSAMTTSGFSPIPSPTTSQVPNTSPTGSSSPGSSRPATATRRTSFHSVSSTTQGSSSPKLYFKFANSDVERNAEGSQPLSFKDSLNHQEKDDKLLDASVVQVNGFIPVTPFQLYGAEESSRAVDVTSPNSPLYFHKAEKKNVSVTQMRTEVSSKRKNNMNYNQQQHKVPTLPATREHTSTGRPVMRANNTVPTQTTNPTSVTTRETTVYADPTDTTIFNSDPFSTTVFVKKPKYIAVDRPKSPTFLSNRVLQSVQDQRRQKENLKLFVPNPPTAKPRTTTSTSTTSVRTTTSTTTTTTTAKTPSSQTPETFPSTRRKYLNYVTPPNRSLGRPIMGTVERISRHELPSPPKRNIEFSKQIFPIPSPSPPHIVKLRKPELPRKYIPSSFIRDTTSIDEDLNSFEDPEDIYSNEEYYTINYHIPQEGNPPQLPPPAVLLIGPQEVVMPGILLNHTELKSTIEDPISYEDYSGENETLSNFIKVSRVLGKNDAHKNFTDAIILAQDLNGGDHMSILQVTGQRDDYYPELNFNEPGSEHDRKLIQGHAQTSPKVKPNNARNPNKVYEAFNRSFKKENYIPRVIISTTPKSTKVVKDSMESTSTSPYLKEKIEKSSIGIVEKVYAHISHCPKINKSAEVICDVHVKPGHGHKTPQLIVGWKRTFPNFNMAVGSPMSDSSLTILNETIRLTQQALNKQADQFSSASKIIKNESTQSSKILHDYHDKFHIALAPGISPVLRSVLLIRSVTAPDTGNYQCVVYDGHRTLTSKTLLFLCH